MTLLVIPVPTGIRIKIGEELFFRNLEPHELLNMGLRFIDAAKEASGSNEQLMLGKT